MSANQTSTDHNSRQLEHHSSQHYQQGMLPPAQQPQYFHGGTQDYSVSATPLAATAPAPYVGSHSAFWISPTAPEPTFLAQQPHQPEYQVNTGHYPPYLAAFTPPYSQGIMPIGQLPLTKSEICASSLVKYFEPYIGFLTSKGALKEFTKKLGLNKNSEQEQILAKAPDKNYAKCTDVSSFESVLNEALTLWRQRDDLGFTHLEAAIRYWIDKTHNRQPLSVYAVLSQDQMAQKLPLTQHLQKQIVSLHQQLQSQHQYQLDQLALQTENLRLNETLQKQSIPRVCSDTAPSSKAGSDTKLNDELKMLLSQNDKLNAELTRMKECLELKEQQLKVKDEQVQEMSQKIIRLETENIDRLTQKAANMMLSPSTNMQSQEHCQKRKRPDTENIDRETKKAANMMTAPSTNIVADHNQGHMAITVNNTHIASPSKPQLTSEEKRVLQNQADQEILTEFISPYCTKRNFFEPLGKNLRLSSDQMWDVEHDRVAKRTPGSWPETLEKRISETWPECFARRAIHYWRNSGTGSKSYAIFLNAFSRTTGKDYYDLASELLLHIPT
ncbi:hypothetical protein D5018_10880 [Parashewanella curva]|uniref:Uncharacterized protein n=1 Tax=Parashewanella curva TaxID=2338552 RepID=A0A3L8PWF7_9GAMM|nr:hypothetical protein [Parashewanella curva]RLV59650.1 hypothetical protein D5018_10880 [Parashewanella curva]